MGSLRCVVAVATVVACRGATTGGTSSARLTEICKTTTNMSAQVCDCVGKKADADLSPDALAFLVASMDKQEAKAAELRSKLTLQEVTKAGMFFVSAPASCATSAAEKP